MAQQIINNLESGLSVRGKLNNMFNELYGSLILPVKLNGVNSNTNFAIQANAYLQSIFLSATDGTPTIRIGTTPNGTEIMPDTNPGSFTESVVQLYFASNTTIYFTVTGGTVNIRMSLLNNFY